MSNGNWREKRSMRPLGDILAQSGQDSGLAGLLARAEQLARLDAMLVELLEPGLAPHVRVANVRDDCLVLVTPVAPIATRLRLLAPTLLEQFRARGVQAFHRIETTVAPLPPQVMQREP